MRWYRLCVPTVVLVLQETLLHELFGKGYVYFHQQADHFALVILSQSFHWHRENYGGKDLPFLQHDNALQSDCGKRERHPFLGLWNMSLGKETESTLLIYCNDLILLLFLVSLMQYLQIPPETTTANKRTAQIDNRTLLFASFKCAKTFKFDRITQNAYQTVRNVTIS